ncbi:MAG: hypothetical protein ABEJ89_08610 [Haloarculaceae archaeon]
MSDTQSFIASHPKLLGALFMMLVLLTQAGSVAANNGASIAGP